MPTVHTILKAACGPLFYTRGSVELIAGEWWPTKLCRSAELSHGRYLKLSNDYIKFSLQDGIN